MGFFGTSKIQKLEKAYQNKLAAAREAQRNGRIQDYAVIMEEAHAILQKIEGFTSVRS